MHKTLVLIKPDGVARNLVGVCLTAFENTGLKITRLKMLQMTREKAELFYAQHKDAYFYEEILEYVVSGPIVALVLEGVGAIKRARRVLGATDPNEAVQGTIRFQYGETIRRNTVHGSDSEEATNREIKIIFDD